MYFKVVFVVINRRGIDANKKNERGEDRTRDLRFRRPTQYPLCHTPLLYSWEVFFPCGTMFQINLKLGFRKIFINNFFRP